MHGAHLLSLAKKDLLSLAKRKACEMTLVERFKEEAIAKAARTRLESHAHDAAADEMLLASSPRRPKPPPKLNLRRVTQLERNSYEAELEKYQAEKKEYDEVLKPAHRKAQMRKVSRERYEVMRRERLEEAARSVVS